MAIFFTADTHFGHGSIIKHCARPYRSVSEMDAALAEQWNSVVSADDTVFHLGDFCFKGSKVATKHLEHLNGEIVLIRGNHDTENTCKLPRWSAVHDILEITVERQKLVLCHYPLLEWPGAFKGVIHLHGHTHGRVPSNQGRVDVGVDIFTYKPVSISDIIMHTSRLEAHNPTDLYAS